MSSICFCTLAIHEPYRACSGEGGVIGLAAECAGLPIDDEELAGVYAAVRHEAGGPKETLASDTRVL